VDTQKPNDALYDKLATEYDAYVDDLKTKSQDEILTAAYPKAWREEILMTFETGCYSDDECAALMKVDNLLDYLYGEWQDTDADYLEGLRDCINGAVERVTGHSLAEPEIEEVTETAERPVNIFVPQDYGSPRQTEVSATAINGKLYVGDWVVVHPDEEYGRLIGQVTAIEKLGTAEHDTDNETDDVHVQFIDYDYSEKDETLIMAGLKKMSPDAVSFDEFALDDVIMAPASLISLTGDDIERDGDARSEILYQLREDANDFLRGYFGDMEDDLIMRVEHNYADFTKSLEDFGASEIIEMASAIHAYSDAYSYLVTGYHGFSDDELQFFMRFENPLQVVADAWRERNIDLDDMSFTIDHIMERQDAVLSEYPLAEEPKPPDIAAPDPKPEQPPQHEPEPKQPPLNKKPSLLDRMAEKKEQVKEYKAQAAQNTIKPSKTNNKERD